MSKKHFIALVLTLFCLVGIQAQTLQENIDSLLQDPMFQRSQVAVLVYDLDGDSVVYRYGERQLMRPASVMKLLTSITALEYLGVNHPFQTSMKYSGSLQQDTVYTDSVNFRMETRIKGDLYIHGGFDPLFGKEDMEDFIQSFRNYNIRRIDGNIYADLSFKDTLKWGEGWCWDDKEATLTPLLYNAKDIFMTRFMQALDADSIQHPSTYYRLTDVVASEASDCETLSVCSHSIGQMLTRMMKESDNLYAESLFYQLGAQAPSSARKSAEREYGFIRSLSLSPDDYTIADGSGLSLYNYLTPQLVVRLLRYAWNNPRIIKALYPTLPIAGRDGTLKKRMVGTPAQDNVRAKTGTLRKVSTLAGYATTSEGTHLAFCIFNQGILNSQEGRDFQDRVCLELVK